MQILREILYYLLAFLLAGGAAWLQFSLLAPLSRRGALTRFLVRCVVSCTGTLVFTAVFFGLGGVELASRSGAVAVGREPVAIALGIGVLYALIWPVAPYLRRPPGP